MNDQERMEKLESAISELRESLFEEIPGLADIRLVPNLRGPFVLLIMENADQGQLARDLVEVSLEGDYGLDDPKVEWIMKPRSRGSNPAGAGLEGLLRSSKWPQFPGNNTPNA